MAKASTLIKTAGGIIGTTVTLLTALRENPQLSEGAKAAIDKVKELSNQENPKLRFDAKIKAIEACADAVEETFDGASEPEQWRERARSLRMRGELAWTANHGKQRRRAMRALNEETADFLEQVNGRLVEMTNESGPQGEVTAS